ncbi:MAG: HD domain-containing protein [Oscillospiraceae bacterium]
MDIESGQFVFAHIEPYEVINVVRNTLGRIDTRIMEHGERVAFIVSEMLEFSGNPGGLDRDKLFILSALHDIGAYKTEEIDRLVSFDGNDLNDHAIYGYLFLKNMSHLGDCSEAVLYHHTPYRQLKSPDCGYGEYAGIIHLADRADILLMQGDKSALKRLRPLAGEIFDPELCELFFRADAERKICERLFSGEYRAVVESSVRALVLSERDVWEYLKMLAYALDFRSEYTVAHTVNTTAISMALGKLVGLSVSDMELLYCGAFLHDLGKIAIPISILEKPGSLTPTEGDVMRTHVVVTDEILRGVVSDDIRLIAARHHEKLNGRGYPEGLAAADLTTLQRIVAIADILSALVSRRSYKIPFGKDKVMDIITLHRNRGELDPELCDLTLAFYDSIMAESAKSREPVEALYGSIKKAFAELSARMG